MGGQKEEAVEIISRVLETSLGPMWSQAIVFQDLQNRAKENLTEVTYQAAWERGKSMIYERVVDRLKAQASG